MRIIEKFKNKYIIFFLTIIVIVIVIVVIFLPTSLKQEPQEKIIENKKSFIENPVFLKLGLFSLMLKDGKSNLRVGLQIMTSNEPSMFYLKSRLPLIKDILYENLGNYSSEELKTDSGRMKMKKKIISEISEIFPKEIPGGDLEPLKELLFDEFVITPAF